jgi:uncharacterized repeat protein (TIGR03803 family)
VSGRFLGGEHPNIAFLQGADGNLYGITEQGGTNNSGVMYKLARTGSYQILYNFCSLPGCPDAPVSITLASDGNFYGAGYTTFFRITPQGRWTQISTLPQSVGGGVRLLQASDGNFYGSASMNLVGAIFRITPTGQFSVVHQFTQDGLGVSSNLLQATDGNIYGATNLSGTGTGIFRLSLSGTFAFIHQMTDSEGFSPGQLLQASDGNLWGLSDFRSGSFFTITLSGISLQSGAFNCASTGCSPTGMIEAADGNFYGIADTGGNAPGENPLGTIFKIAAGLPH